MLGAELGQGAVWCWLHERMVLFVLRLHRRDLVGYVGGVEV